MAYVSFVSLASDTAPKQFVDSLHRSGFAVLTDHGISAELINAVYQEWERFFARADKMNFQYDRQTQAGYFPFKAEKAKGATVPDLKEFYHYYVQHGLPDGIAPRTPELREALNHLAVKLLSWIDEALPPKTRQSLSQPLSQMIQESDQTLFRIIHYPALLEQPEVGAVRAAAHEDINMITLLPAATAPGLEVLDREGQWHQVSCDPGMVVVNVGDMLQEATQGYFPSTTHRVVNPTDVPEQSRYSMPLFLHARPDVVLSPRYTAHTYLQERLKELGLV